MNKFIKLLAVLLFVVTLWFQRHIFFDSYDATYMHEFYSMSQWALPLSSRIMGDASLYAYSGYELLNNAFKPFGINPETPILAKLMFGASTTISNNPHYASVLFLLLLLIGIDQIAKHHFDFSKNKRILLAIFVFCSAEIQEQIVHTLLDLPQVALFVWHLVFLFKFKESQQRTHKNGLLAGLFLGFMTAAKFGLYTPFILLIDAWYLYKNTAKKFIPTVLIFTVFGYILPYLPVIITEGPIQFLKAQKWIYNFYTSSGVIAPKYMILITSFTGLNKGWTNNEWNTIYSWNGEWALGIIALFTYVYGYITNKIEKNKELFYILSIISIVFLILLKIPFWPRYMIFFVPFFWLLILNYITEKKFLLLLLVFPLISTSKLALRSYMPPKEYLSNWNVGGYAEVYNYTSNSYKKNTTREEFVIQNFEEFENIHPHTISTEIIKETEQNSVLTQEMLVTLSGFSGTKEITKELTWIRENAQWKINEIHNIDQDAVYNPEAKQQLCVNPTKVQDWSAVYASIGTYYDIATVQAKEKVMQLVPRDYCIPVGEIDENKPLDMLEGMEVIE